MWFRKGLAGFRPIKLLMVLPFLRRLLILLLAFSVLIFVIYIAYGGGDLISNHSMEGEEGGVEEVFEAQRKTFLRQRLETQKLTTECACSDGKGTVHDFCYALPENKSIYGKRFSCDHVMIMNLLGLLNTSDIPFAIDDIKNPAYVTAFSANHQNEALQLMRTVAKYRRRDQRMIAYDLGSVQTKLFEKHTFLKFRRFNYSRYPTYVGNLLEYRWKPIIIAEALQEFGAIWYMDSSVVLKKKDLTHVYALVNCRNKVRRRPPLRSVEERDLREAQIPHENGWDITQWRQNVAECRKAAYLLHGYTGHGIYSATSRDVYTFIPTNFSEIKKPKAKMYEAGFVFAAKTRDTLEMILKWYVLCALEKDCMAGNHREHLRCNFQRDQFSSPPTCHRFDQSVVNLLAANAFWYDRHYYVSEIVDFFNIVRS